MGFFRYVFRWYIRASIHVSLCLLALVGFTFRVFNTGVHEGYCAALFFGSIAGYNTIKFGLQPGKVPRWVPGEGRLLLLVSLASALMGAWFLAQLPAATLGFMVLAGLLTALYAVPLTPGGANLRSFGLLKILLVALVWTLLSVWAPLWDAPNLILWDVGVESAQRMLWVFLLMLPFEIRDMGSDPPGMRSFPQRYGLRVTRRVAWIAAVVFALFTFAKDVPAPGEFGSKALAAALMGMSVAFAGRNQNPYYASFWVEGIPLVALGALLLLQA